MEKLEIKCKKNQIDKLKTYYRNWTIYLILISVILIIFEIIRSIEKELLFNKVMILTLIVLPVAILLQILASRYFIKKYKEYELTVILDKTQIEFIENKTSIFMLNYNDFDYKIKRTGDLIIFNKSIKPLKRKIINNGEGVISNDVDKKVYLIEKFEKIKKINSI